jgi:site-specific DNA-methyltransferase (adenine-specific)
MKYQIINGNNIDVLKTFPDNHFDSIVTDPPYGIDFLGKSWDANTGALETYQECLRVLKPGGHILAFSAARTYHHLAITLEQAGFEIRDQIMWIYSSGFPKSQDVGKSIQRGLGVKEKKALPKEQQTSTAGFAKNGAQEQSAWSGETTVCTDPEAVQWAGWGTALKPAHEPIALARKPIKGSIKDNVLKHGVGALNIDATRVPYASEQDKNAIDHKVPTAAWSGHTIQVDSYEKGEFVKVETNDLGRFPSNVLGEIPDYQKYFYCPKVSRRERHTGYDIKKVPVIEFNDPGKIKEHPLWDPSIGTNVQRLKEKIRIHNESCIPTDPGGMLNSASGNGHYTGNKQTSAGNNHPTVKPIELMKYLIKLITPKGGIVLDPFNGSGSTGCAAVELGCEYVGIELDPAYVEIAKKRIEAWNKEDTTFTELFE